MPLLDFRSITRKGPTTQVCLYHEYRAEPWILCGEINLTYRENADIWMFGARLADGTTDVEHDSAWAFRFDLVGIRLKYIDYGATHIEGWIRGDPGGAEDTRIAKAGFNPKKVKGVEKCTSCEDKHIILPPGHYLPAADPAYFDMVRGRRIEITTGYSKWS